MALMFLTLIGVAFWGFEQPYNPIYSIFVVFVEWWRIRERKLAVRWETRGAIKVEKLRVEFHPVRKMDDDDADAGFPWYKREIRVLTSLPVIGASAMILQYSPPVSSWSKRSLRSSTLSQVTELPPWCRPSSLRVGFPIP
jgi:hypothetical protein